MVVPETRKGLAVRGIQRDGTGYDEIKEVMSEVPSRVSGWLQDGRLRHTGD